MPAAHCGHEAPEAYEPGAHALHAEAAASAAYVPAAQLVQALPPLASIMEPGAHGWHLSAPLWFAK